LSVRRGRPRVPARATCAGRINLQGTKPETIGIALADSPADQAAWIYDNFRSKTDNNRLAEDALTTDQILDTIPLHW
jgi:hypothetical protein